MTMTKYVPSWEKDSNRWETEPEIWDNDLLDEETESESDEISLDLVEIDDVDLSYEMEDEEFDLE